MRLVRFRFPGNPTRYGILDKDQVHGLRGNPFQMIQRDGSSYPLSEVRLLAPCRPSKVVCVGLNYREHAAESGHPVPVEPILFLKPSTSIIDPDAPILLPPGVQRVDAEAELAVVIGRRARNVPRERAAEYIFGYTCFNDVSARDYQRKDGQWTRGKSFDSFGPIGPWVDTEVDPGALQVTGRINGEVRQNASTTILTFDVPYLVSFISAVMTLLPGDVIATGTPSGVSALAPGDLAEVEVSGLGVLRNPVRAAVAR